MPSGLVFAAIVVIWAIILIPRMVRVYDMRATERTTRRFQHAMASLGEQRRARRGMDVMLVRRATPAVHGVLFDPAVDLHLDHGVDPFLGDEEDQRRRRARREAARQVALTAARRRRRVLAGAVAVTVAMTVLAGLSMVPMWLAMVPTVLTTSVVVVYRRQRRRQEVWLAELAERSAARASRALQTNARVAPVVAVVPQAAPEAAPVPAEPETNDVVVLRTGEGAGSVQAGGGAAPAARRRANRRAQARLAEQQRALAATYADAEEELGLDAYASPSQVRRAHLRAANE
jgi:hypothetical protein